MNGKDQLKIPKTIRWAIVFVSPFDFRQVTNDVAEVIDRVTDGLTFASSKSRHL